MTAKEHFEKWSFVSQHIVNGGTVWDKSMEGKCVLARIARSMMLEWWDSLSWHEKTIFSKKGSIPDWLQLARHL